MLQNNKEIGHRVFTSTALSVSLHYNTLISITCIPYNGVHGPDNIDKAKALFLLLSEGERRNAILTGTHQSVAKEASVGT